MFLMGRAQDRGCAKAGVKESKVPGPRVDPSSPSWGSGFRV